MKLLVVFLVGCATTATVPASVDPKAPVGRLAGVPATLRAGVATYDAPPMREDTSHQHHHH